MNQPSFSEIINLDELKKLFEAFSSVTGFTTGLVDPANNKVLLETGWRDICVSFHRAHPDSRQHCQSSNLLLTKGLQTFGEIRVEHCRNGLVDACTPIIIKGNHLANLFTGQVFFSPPNINRFKEQAQRYGYDEQLYLAAVAKAPVVEEKQFIAMLQFLFQITMTTVQLGMTNLRVEKSNKELLKAYSLKTEMEKTLRIERDNLKNIFGAMEDGVYMVDQTYTIQYVNPVLEKEFGSYEGHKCFEYFYDREEACPWCKIDDIFDGRTVHWEWTSPKSNKTYDLLDTPIHNSDGSISKLEILHDITARVQLEKELKKERQRLRSILEGTNVGTYEWNIQTDEAIINERFFGIVGYTREEFSHLSFAEFAKLYHPDDLKKVGILLEKHFNGESDYYECEMRLRHKNGDWVWVLDRGKVTVWTEEGKPELMFGMHKEITARKVAEAALQKSHDTLDQRVAERTGELEKVHHQLRHVEKLSAMGQFTASIAHEINNPLTGILNVLARLKRKVVLEESEAKLLALALSEGDRMKRLIQDLQSFNRPSSGKKAVFELQKTVATILQLSRKELTLHHVSVETHFAPKPIEINGVEDQIRQVILNLVKNAMDAIPDSGGMIDVTITADEQLATINLHDSGCGIKTEHLDKIFDSFFTTKPAVTGTGLGLSVSYNIIKAHDGDMSVSSEPDKGTTFTITLPINLNHNTRGISI